MNFKRFQNIFTSLPENFFRKYLPIPPDLMCTEIDNHNKVHFKNSE